ncbi:MAG: PEGA domain-containing protein [Bacteroidetes bacterium]|nr:PEGA domain-containing protein [Bacteroidota bacterium]
MRAKFCMVMMAVTLLCSPGSAQEGETSPGQTAASITVTTNIDSARLFIDSTFAGYTPTTVDTLSPGTYTLRLVHPEVTSWLTSNVTDTVTLSPGEARNLRYTLQEWYYLNSIPSGADIYINDSLAGATPMVLNALLLTPGASVSLTKEGYDPAVAGPTEFQRGSLILPLTRIAGTEPLNGSIIMQQMPVSSNALRLHVAGYSTLLFGAMTAYLRIRADKANEQFFRTQNPAYLSRRDRLDSQAIAAILITQISLGLFIYFLLSE